MQQVAIHRHISEEHTAISNCIRTSMMHATHVLKPYDYWVLGNILPDETIDAVMKLPFPLPDSPIFDGRRESNNSSRVYFSQENQMCYPVCKQVAQAFSDPVLLAVIDRMTGSDVSKGYLRIEYCQDTDGFWLEPHLDLGVKLFTMLIYLSDDPNLFDAGTDIYDDTPEHNLVASAPYERNKGLIFIPGTNTWHGFHKRPIRGLRRSLIINYVSDAWRNKEELAYP